MQNESATGSTTTTRVRTTLTITIEKTDFDTQAGALHVAGRVSEENKYVKMGQYHTLDLETQRNVTIIKDEWDSVEGKDDPFVRLPRTVLTSSA